MRTSPGAWRWLPYCLLLLVQGASVAVAQAAPKDVKGKVKKGIYQSPAGNFSVPVWRRCKISDGHARLSDGSFVGGAVSFHCDWGDLRGIHYTFLPNVGAAPDSAAGFLATWLQTVALEGWFRPAAPESRILAETEGTFEDMPALFALIDAPGASAVETVVWVEGKMQLKREDSRRVVVVFRRDPYVYMVTGETATFGPGAGARAEPDGDWVGRIDDLVEFYRSITFMP